MARVWCYEEMLRTSGWNQLSVYNACFVAFSMFSGEAVPLFSSSGYFTRDYAH